MKRLLFVLLTAAMLVPLGACSTQNVYQTYPDATRYSIGNGNLKDVQALDIHWLSGTVNVVADDATSVTFAETAHTTPGEDATMRYWLDNGTLRIHFAQSGARLAANLSKTLTVKVPRALLNKVQVASVSADVNLNGLSAADLSATAVSGNVVLTGVNAPQLAAESTSGRVQIWDCTVDALSIRTISGDILFNGAKAPKRITAHTVSGDFLLSLPAATGVQCTYSTISGSYTNRLPQGTDCVVQAETTSGDISILAR